ncbi:bifunctional (p)ppGpp synthetase/guanosine-3',5'-bis(diphosphate) 3'-pyrophosphohydrolase [Bacillus thuringiensis]|uniref:GTP pyrophosphokinase n=3 Tax=Bacillus cereus group TaxID=86661 RepID=B7IJR7_BACC2|nr:MULTISPECIES: HD domain-containing protein [Bacillus cereus group]ACK93774.1 GTP pyrophosphokinase [Bacillus cereus G9842]KAA6458387.1 bifunctional (p)ppGpp synthetase/guanosine-3',5'-bis(diphosphate) 3'-pyrophosphohydrolase [Bacillus cereus]KAA6478754.1 bifunctional (p)ppGpp synthetase/guanosine-3',5'-bis(diphosphate) 3'-pyrophosphohydrolase [Bacillus cereus]KAB2418736.1 bifunctional (p)ppGpp synthetase/guanosine-3',5'-bis(diphosphate) 3'-pyrophosphohydrolase [Bacillus cereus]KAB2437439.1 
MKKKLLEKASYLHKAELEQLLKAILVSEKAHEGQFRVSGEPYITHPFAVTEILLDCKADIITLVAALLHDVVEDTDYTIEYVRNIFGKKVADIVEGLTKIDKKQIPNKEEYEAINLKKLLLATHGDIRVAIIKVIDRLHNMRTLQVKAVKKQVPYANETLKIFAPICKRLGLFHIQHELEDLGFYYLNHSKYKGMKILLQNYVKLLEELSQNIRLDIKNFLNRTLIFEVDYEVIPIYTAYSRLQDIQDITAVSKIIITVSSNLDCYKILGIIHQLYKPIPHQFEDNIAIESESDVLNKYLKTKVVINNHEIVICIETKINQEIRYKGVFHILTKSITDKDMQNIIHKLMDHFIKTNDLVTQDAIEFYDLVSYELFQDNIVAFTPKLDSVKLPQGSTVIDFAFELNPEIAKYMSGAKVNGINKPITTNVSHLDIVELLVTENISNVRQGWLSFANSSKAQIEICKELQR